MFQLAYWLTRNRFVSLLAGVTYMSSPYLLVNVHARGAFTEAVAQGILPMVLYYSFRCYATPRITFFLLASTSWFLLATSHLIT
ncbi:MAG: hypothetical protein NTY64_14760, partial [Deltaproteobacteria bacterium]|nr:hypothetical protein [Deltaproteobacteria bacterium]